MRSIKAFILAAMMVSAFVPAMGMAGSVRAEDVGSSIALGSCTDQGLDMNGNGLYDHLEFYIEVSSVSESFGILLYTLQDDQGQILTDDTLYIDLYPGPNIVPIYYPGQFLASCGQKGFYVLAVELMTNDGTYTNTYQSQTYDVTEFEHAELIGPAEVITTDANNNGKNEYVTVRSGVQVSSEGYYDLYVSVVDDCYNTVAWGYVSAYLTPEATRVWVAVPGSQFAQSGLSGPYTAYLFMYFGGFQVASLSSPLAGLGPEDFEPAAQVLSGGSDTGIDDNGDGQFDWLEVTVSFDVAYPGVYDVSAWLQNTGQGAPSVQRWFDAGVHTLTFRFSGFDIWMSGADGPYGVLFEVRDGIFNPVSYGSYLTGTYLAGDFKKIVWDLQIGTDRNKINLGSDGVISLVIYGSDWFDVNLITPDLVFLNDGAIYAQPWRSSIKDFNGDGWSDLMLKYKTSAFSSSPVAPRGQLYVDLFYNWNLVHFGVGSITMTMPSLDYHIVALGTLGGGNSYGYDINSRGQVVGSSDTAESMGYMHAFSWTKAGGMVDLNPTNAVYSIARAVNDRGDVVGNYWGGGGAYDQACLWTADGHFVDLGALWGGTMTAAYAHDINNNGMVVGHAYTYDEIVSPSYFVGHAVVWTKGPGGYTCTDIGTLPGGNMAWAWGVNDRNEVVGMSATRADLEASMEYHAFLWTADGGMVDLGRLDGVSAQEMCVATGISNNGQIVGRYLLTDPWSGIPSNLGHGFRANDGGHGLAPVLNPGYFGAYVQAINRKGEMAGAVCLNDYYSRHAAMWSSAGVLLDLGTLPGGWESYAASINARGTVVGSSSWYDEGVAGYQATIWTT